MEAHVPSRDRRARFVGADAYQAAGGRIVRDLFAEGDAFYLEDVALLDRLTAEKLACIAADLKAEGWRWVEAHVDYPHSHGLRRVHAEPVPLTDEQQERLDAVCSERDALIEPYEGDDELPEDVAERYAALEAEIEQLSNGTEVFSPEVMAHAGVFASIAHDGRVSIDRAFIRREDEKALTENDAGETADAPAPSPPKLLSDALVRDLTAHRTLALRLAVGNAPDVALMAVVHAMAADTFYFEGDWSCLDIRAVSASLIGWAEGIADTDAGRAVTERHEAWQARLPERLPDLWQVVADLSAEDRLSLLAHCASLTIHAVKQPNDRRPNAFAVADALASAVSLDMARHWSPTVASYLGRVSKPQIVDTVREGASAEAAKRIEGLKKQAMAEAAEKALAGRGWLPGLLRFPVRHAAG